MGRIGRGLWRNLLPSANTARGTDLASSGRLTQNLQTRGTLCRNTRVPVVITLCTSPTLAGPLPPRPHWATENSTLPGGHTKHRPLRAPGKSTWKTPDILTGLPLDTYKVQSTKLK
ncbi:hypothetical protein AVEN_84923-1 [Araneus ventricosus]|uniref:Uncharacterized protein n=1 Tax=Araneus ventricosus TaxID=182803 RepID=A0A4Y2BYH7_ARAVE|nr:hypothetical protein AVEN_84923-1 [Araneus ventricosus]